MFLDGFSPACAIDPGDFEAVLCRNTIDTMERIKILVSEI
jgi:hypothetical protein